MVDVVARSIVRLTGEAEAPRLRGWPLLVGFLAATPAAAALLVHASGRGHTGAVGIYAAGLVALYAVGWVYHLLRWSPPARARLRRLDHAVIYFFIAASYTPVAVVLHDTTAWLLLAGVWVGASVGIVAKLVHFEGARRIGGTMYIVVGWLPIVGAVDFVHRLGGLNAALMFGGGLLYTGGAAVLASRRPDPLPVYFGYHEVWHTMVLAASVLHYLLVWRVV